MKIPLLLAAVLAVAACSSATKTSSADPCAALPGDTIYTRFQPAYRPCGLESKAVAIMPRATPNYTPPSSTRSASCTSAEFEFVVDTMGVVEPNTPRVVRSSNPEYADAIMSVLPSWRFQPAKKDGKFVRQIVNEKLTLQTRVVAVPAGSPPPRGNTSGGTRIPTTC